ncbi:IgA FC receptor [Vanrija pseudolonga]|uniref:IgA FC receptor n=1 Tax=Vanrija pseudolonga TaxID=143232 RepID=A0AAF1BI39_9TREE|nr:IgA FC receptor [Vanrija pseudolonga]
MATPPAFAAGLQPPLSAMRSTLPQPPPFEWQPTEVPFYARRPPPFIRVRALGHVLARLGMTEEEALAMGSRYSNWFIEALERGEWRRFAPQGVVYPHQPVYAEPAVKDERDRSATPEPRAAGAYMYDDEPPVKREPRSPSPAVKEEPGAPYVKQERATPEVKTQPESPKVKTEPASPKVKLEPTSPKVKQEPRTPHASPPPVPARTPGEIITAAALRAAEEVSASMLSGDWRAITPQTVALNIVYEVLSERDSVRREGTRRSFRKWMRARIASIKAAAEDAATLPAPPCPFDQAKRLCLVALEVTFCLGRDAADGWPEYARRPFDVARLGAYAA